MQNLQRKKITTVNGTEYILNEQIGEGAQGVVYTETNGEHLIKLYNNGSPIQNRNKINKLNWLIKQDFPDQFIKPLEIIETPYVGYSMKQVKGHVSLNRLLVPSKDNSFADWYNKETGGLRRRFFLGYKIAMQFAMLHETNRAYCDISGNNILVNEDSKVASVCMIDIDNIYIPGGDSGNVLGTSRYMAPEIMKKQMLPDIFTDCYSLAVILFEILRVGHPYIGDVVEDGTPEQQEQAYLGLYPYVDDDENEMNRSSQMLPENVVFTKEIRELFKRTFINGKENRMERATARDFALAFLEASNKVMKCPVCGSWHLATPSPDRKYYCPWCDEENPRPLFLQFKDRCVVKEPGKEAKKDDIPINSFVIRREKNDVTENYISNFYVRRNKFDSPVSQYFTIRMAMDGKYYIINSSGRELYLKKAAESRLKAIQKTTEPLEISQGDMIFFEDVTQRKEEAFADQDYYRGVLFRYAILR